MPRRKPLYDWTRRVATAFPELRPAHARALAEWSYAMVLTQAATLAAVALQLAAIAGQRFNAVRQRIRELYRPPRAELAFDPAACCGPLLRWITAGWTDKRIALALDASNLGDRFTVLAASIVYRGIGLPVAWTIKAGKTPTGSWNPIWKTLLGRVKAALGDGWDIYVLTDRGMESATLFRTIRNAGAHPMMRVKAGNRFRPAGWSKAPKMGRFAAKPGSRFAAGGTAYPNAKTEPLQCTLLACRMDGCDDPWLILTDSAPSSADPAWYGFRGWIEQGFRAFKRGGWRWARSRMTDPQRAERVFAAMALAEVWAVEVGGAAELDERAIPVPPLNPSEAKPKKPKPKRRARAGRKPKRGSNRPGSERTHRLFARGIALIVAGLLAGRAPSGRFELEPWPARKKIPRISEAEFDKQDATYP
jgi:hypothetical protein